MNFIMDLELLKKIKKLAIIAMFSDDSLMDKIALKGGNAIDFFYENSARSSIDLDFSMRADFDLDNIKPKLKKVLEETFDRSGFFIFDIEITERPRKIENDLKNFWGGYRIEFKIIEKGSYDKEKGIEYIRNKSISVNPNQGKKFKIEISKFEYFESIEKELDYYTVHVYTGEMIVLEKIRAICQQTNEYRKIIRTKYLVPRARDFFDIFVMLEKYHIDPNSSENKELLKNIFKAKKVPLELLKKIEEHKEMHRNDFPSLEITIKPGIKLKSFDFYFNYVVDKLKEIEF